MTRLRILCSGHLVRHPVGGHSWHHLQYLIGLQRLGHDVTFFEHFGWPNSCYDPARAIMTDDPAYGVAYTQRLLDVYGLGERWCYLAADGSSHGLSREELAEICRTCDLYLNLSNINWIPELEQCRRRALVDTDPVFTQIGAHGLGGPFARYDVLFTYGENVHRPGCGMPAGGARWLPTRQPVVLDLWTAGPAARSAPFTTVMNWSPFGDVSHDGRVYGGKDRSFEAFLRLPQLVDVPVEFAVGAPSAVRARLLELGWRVVDPGALSRDPFTYRRYIEASRAEFTVAKHGYVVTRCGWFSDRSACYLASGRPVVTQDTGFGSVLPVGEGLFAFETMEDVLAAFALIVSDYDRQSARAREIAREHFDSGKVLSHLIDRAMASQPATAGAPAGAAFDAQPS